MILRKQLHEQNNFILTKTITEMKLFLLSVLTIFYNKDIKWFYCHIYQYIKNCIDPPTSAYLLLLLFLLSNTHSISLWDDFFGFQKEISIFYWFVHYSYFIFAVLLFWTLQWMSNSIKWFSFLVYIAHYRNLILHEAWFIFFWIFQHNKVEFQPWNSFFITTFYSLLNIFFG